MSLKTKLINFSIKKLLHKISRPRQSILQDVTYKHNSHPKTFNWDWSRKSFNRIAVVNYLVGKTGGLSSRYLEIGCASNDLFHSVASLHKAGVDPASGGTHRMTSDDFFATNKEVFDVIFVDGLHEYEQVHRDAINALNTVEVGGWIAFHDLLPSSWKEHHVPRISGQWTGDCWKLAVQLKASTGVEFTILDIDHGVGVMRKISNEWHVPEVSDELKAAGFDKFVEIVEALPIRSFETGMKIFSES